MVIFSDIPINPIRIQINKRRDEKCNSGTFSVEVTRIICDLASICIEVKQKSTVLTLYIKIVTSEKNQRKLPQWDQIPEIVKQSK